MAEAAVLDDHLAKIQHPPRVPNRKKLEDDVAASQALIKCKEAEIKTLASKAEKLQPELETLRSSKLSLNQRRQSINNDLTRVNSEICKQEAELARVQSSLQYRNEGKINEAIQRLETQLLTRNFTLTEEKKIVSEIDVLKRSKKNLGAYLILKKQIDEKRESARQMRGERDKMVKDVTKVRQQEDAERREMQSAYELMNKLKHEISELQKKIHLLKKEFGEQEKLYNEWRRKHLVQVHRAKHEERKAAVEAHQLEIAEMQAISDPFESERHLCNTLINYLHQFLAPDDDMDKLMTSSLPATLNHYIQDFNRNVDTSGMKRLQRKSDDEEQYVVCTKPKAARRMKKEKKKIASRKAIVTPEIFSQFSQLGLPAPVCVAEIPTAIEQLMSRLTRLTLAPYQSSANQSASSDSCKICANQSTSFDTVPSSAASYTGSSVPTTPDVQTDVPPRLLSSSYEPHAGTVSCIYSSSSGDNLVSISSVVVTEQQTKRRLSHDSGSYELEDSGVSCVEATL